MPCTLFPTQHRQESRRSELFRTKLYQDWNRVREDAFAYEVLQYHIDADAKLDSIMKTWNDSSLRPDV